MPQSWTPLDVQRWARSLPCYEQLIPEMWNGLTGAALVRIRGPALVGMVRDGARVPMPLREALADLKDAAEEAAAGAAVQPPLPTNVARRTDSTGSGPTPLLAT
jgi:hypothetical protein